MILRQVLYVREVLKNLTRSNEEINELRRNRLDEITNLAYKNFEIYRNKWGSEGVSPEDIEDFEDVKQVPTVQERSKLERYFDNNSSENYLLSSGSASGGRTRIEFDDQSWEYLESIYLRGFLKNGYSLRESQTYLWSEPFNRGFFKDFFLPKNRVDTDCTLEEQLEQIQVNGDPNIVYFAHVLFTLAKKKIQSDKEYEIAPKRIITHGNVLTDNMRDTISRAFGNPDIYDHYGCTELNRIAWECPEGGYHINQDSVHIELLNDENNEVEQNEVGRIVATGLINTHSPFVRYELSDIAIKGEENPQCNCENNFSKLEKILGRRKDVITIGGTRIYPYDIIECLAKYDDLLTFNFKRESGEFVVEYVKNSDFSEQTIEKAKGDLNKMGIQSRFTQIEKNGFTPGGKIMPVDLSI